VVAQAQTEALLLHQELDLMVVQVAVVVVTHLLVRVVLEQVVKEMLVDQEILLLIFQVAVVVVKAL
jgi:hypothetical protein